MLDVYVIGALLTLVMIIIFSIWFIVFDNIKPVWSDVYKIFLSIVVWPVFWILVIFSQIPSGFKND
jgi:hypothetical protein